MISPILRQCFSFPTTGERERGILMRSTKRKTGVRISFILRENVWTWEVWRVCFRLVSHFMQLLRERTASTYSLSHSVHFRQWRKSATSRKSLKVVTLILIREWEIEFLTWVVKFSCLFSISGRSRLSQLFPNFCCRKVLLILKWEIKSIRVSVTLLSFLHCVYQ